MIKLGSSSCHSKPPPDTDEADATVLMADLEQRLDQQVRDDGQSAEKGNGSTAKLACK